MTGEEALNLGIMYYKGEIVEQNYHKAFKLFKQAEKLGNKESYRWLGFCCYEGYGTSVNRNLTFKYLEKALEFNSQDAEILYYLGKCYFCGWRTGCDRTKAFEHWLPAGELGFSPAFYWIMHSYYFGYGVEKDLNKALFWAEKHGDKKWINPIKEEIRSQPVKIPDY